MQEKLENIFVNKKNTLDLKTNIWEMKLLKMSFPKLQPSLGIRMLDMMVQG